MSSNLKSRVKKLELGITAKSKGLHVIPLQYGGCEEKALDAYRLQHPEATDNDSFLFVLSFRREDCKINNEDPV